MKVSQRITELYDRFYGEIKEANNPQDPKAIKRYCAAIHTKIPSILSFVSEDPVYVAQGFYGKFRFATDNSSLVRFIRHDGKVTWEAAKKSVTVAESSVDLVKLMVAAGLEEALLVIVSLNYLLSRGVCPGALVETAGDMFTDAVAVECEATEEESNGYDAR